MVTLVLMAVAILLYVFWHQSKPSNFPPGPTHWPLIGGLFYVMTLPSEMHKRVKAMAHRYGNISGYYLGPIPFVFASESEIVKEALTKEELSNRPTNAGRKLTKSRPHMLGISFAAGEFWKEQRRFTLRHLRDFGFGKRNMEGLIHEEVEAVLKEVQTKAGPDWKLPVPVDDILGTANVNVLLHVMFGERYEHSDERLLYLISLVREWSLELGSLSDFTLCLPKLHNFVPLFPKQSNMISVKTRIQKFVMEHIMEHKRSLDISNPRDFSDVYLTEMINRESTDSSFSYYQLRAICMDLFIAGSDTTSGVINFAMLYMVLNPKIQEKVQLEIDQVVGKHRLPSLKDRPSLPFTDATILEVLRLRPSVPVIPRGTSCEKVSFDFRNHTIPKNSVFLIDLLSLHMDPSYWDEPETFNPERFLDADGQLKKTDAFLPFGAGTRSCLGKSLASNNLFLFFSAILQHFRLRVPDGESPPRTDPCGGLNIAPHPFNIQVEPRL